MQNPKLNILYMDLGESGQGGSFLSLRDHIAMTKNQFGNIFIILVNPSVFEEEYKKLGCVVIRLNHPIYSKHNRRYLWLYNKLFSLAHKVSEHLCLFLQKLFEYHFAIKLYRILKGKKIEVIHLNNQPMRNFSGFVAAKKAALPVVSHIRTMHTYGFSNTFATYINQLPVSFIAISEAVKREWSRFSINSQVIYNPVPIKDIALKKFEKKYDLIFIGRLIPQKGVENLLVCLAKFDVPPTLAIVGDGPSRAKLEKLVKKFSLDNKVIFYGFQKNPYKYILNAKACVFPSEDEGMGRVLVEAMRLKIPVIANSVGGIKEIVEHNHTGLLYYSNDKDALFHALKKLLASNSLQQQLAVNAYLKAQSLFDTNSYKSAMMGIYHG